MCPQAAIAIKLQRREFTNQNSSIQSRGLPRNALHVLTATKAAAIMDHWERLLSVEVNLKEPWKVIESSIM